MIVLRSLEQPLLLDFPAWTFAFPKVLYSDAWLTPDNPGPVQARVKTITRLRKETQSRFTRGWSMLNDGTDISCLIIVWPGS